MSACAAAASLTFSPSSEFHRETREAHHSIWLSHCTKTTKTSAAVNLQLQHYQHGCLQVAQWRKSRHGISLDMKLQKVQLVFAQTELASTTALKGL